MNKYFNWAMPMAALLLTLAACQNDDNTVTTPAQTPVSLSFGLTEEGTVDLHTRATGTALDATDVVGVYFAAVGATTLDKLTDSKTGNNRYAYDATAQTWQGTPVYWEDLGGISVATDVYAYCPHSATAPLNAAKTAISWTVNTDQSTRTGLVASDLLTGKLAGLTSTGANSTLTLSHALAKLRINLINNSGTSGNHTAEQLSAATIVMKNIATTATIGLMDGNQTVSDAATPADITPMKLDAPATSASVSYEAVSIPSTLAAGTTVAVVTLKNDAGDNISYTITPDTDLALAQGKINSLNVTITKSGVHLSFGVTDWESGNTATGSSDLN